jgi:hypothetical protein
LGWTVDANALARLLAARGATAKGLAPGTVQWTIDALRAVGKGAALEAAAA